MTVESGLSITRHHDGASGSAGADQREHPGRELRVLIIEDVAANAELAMLELKKAGLACRMQRVETAAQYVRQLDECEPDIILSDFVLPRFDGVLALEIARAKCPQIPFIYLAGSSGEETAVRALKSGAIDYVLKANMARLAPAVTRALQEAGQRRARAVTAAELASTRERLDGILNSLSEVIWSVTPDTRRVTYLNPAAAVLYGRPAADFLTSPQLLSLATHPEDRDDVAAAWNDVAAGKRIDLEYRIVHADGSVRWVHTRARRVDVPGAEARIDGITADITGRKLQEVRIARLNRIQRVLSGINSAIVRIRDRRELLAEACRIAVEHGGFRLAWIGLLDPATGAVEPQVWAGEENGFLNGMRLSARDDVPEGRGIAGYALRTGKPVVINDVASDMRPLRRASLLGRGFRGVIVLPLVVEARATGLMMLYAAQPGVFDQDELRLLSELAGDISFALQYLAKEEQLSYLAYYDSLTGLANRNLFTERLAQMFSLAQHRGRKIGLILLDLQGFSIINDSFGRQAGDLLLKQVALRLQAAAPEPAQIARVAADTFAIAVPAIAEEAHVAHILEREIWETLGQPFSIHDQELRLAVRCGIAVFPGDGADVDAVFRNAEAALKQAKRKSEKYLFYAPTMNARVAEKLRLENELREAVRKEQFILHYQPRLALATGKIVGLEALIRWISPQRGLVAPGEFIPLLEESGLILEVGRWALTRANADSAAWRARGLRPPPIGVNVSAIQLRQKDFVEQVAAAVAAGAGSLGHIELELTESMVLEDFDVTTQKLRQLRAAGMQVAIDDFGTGYSSLSYLARLPLDTLKVDRSFIMDINMRSQHRAIVATIISLAHSLQLKVVAEGVETQAQADTLCEMQCDEVQGYFYSRPVPPDEAARLIG